MPSTNSKGSSKKKTSEISPGSSNLRSRKEIQERKSGEKINDGGDGKAQSLIEHKSKESSKSSSSKKKSKDKKSPKSQPQGLLGLICGKTKYIFLILFIPPFLNYASLQKEGAELKPDGELYDVGWGQNLFLSCTGEGQPTVVLDAPTGMSSDVWSLIVPKLAALTRVCVYDRAGIGFSDRPKNRSVEQSENVDGSKPWIMEQNPPFTLERMAEDLHKLITSSSQQPRPLVLVGAELGAMVAQFYTYMYESDVESLVMVNPLPDELFKQAGGVWQQYWFGTLSPWYQTLQLGAALGLTRLGLLMGLLKQPVQGRHIPDNVVNRQKYLLCNPRHLSSIVDEHHFINETFSQMRTIRKVKPFPSNITVSVLIGNYYDEQMPSHLNKAWAQAEQALLSKMFPQSQQLVVNGADRHMAYKQPESIIEVVSKIVKRWRKKNIVRNNSE